MPSTTPIMVYTDGACDPNPGKGGWAVVIQQNGEIKKLSGGEAQTTNNRMELMAAIMALRSIPTSIPIVINSDSEYVKKGITEWMPDWKKRGWKRKGGALANLDLWQELDRLNSKAMVTWKWVKGHAGHPMNELADQLASKASQQTW
jgi:ribonuclease HI